MVKRTLVVVALLLMVSVSLLAHHSLAGVYDMKGDKSITGSLEKLQFVNPHGSLTVKAEGTNDEWVMTLGSATGLAQRGIGKTGPNALHIGDKITVTFLPAINGSHLGFLKTVKLPDGRVIQISSGSPND